MKRYDEELSTTDSDSSAESDDTASTSSDDEDQPQQHKSNTLLFTVILVVLGALAAGGVYFYESRSSSTSAVDATSTTTASGYSLILGVKEATVASAESSAPTGAKAMTTTGKTDASSSSSSSSSSAGTTTSAATSTATSTTSNAVAVSSTSTTSDSVVASSTSISTPLSPNGVKAGIAGGDGFDSFSAHVSWWYDWGADDGADHTADGVTYFNMLWGDGTVDDTDAARLAAFEAITTTPVYILGFNEPDLSSSVSAGMSPADAATLWESDIAPWQAKGSLLGSPAPGKQAGETWLAEFEGNITTMWDFTAAHIYQSDSASVQTVIDHYTTYGKPIFITEWGCVNVSDGFVAIEDQDLINSYIDDCVDLFEANDNVAGYAAIIDGSGLGNTWPLVADDGTLSATGETYLAAISKYY